VAKAVNKAQAIRDYLAENRKATAKDVVAALAQKGIMVTPQRVNLIKSKAKPKPKRASVAASVAARESKKVESAAGSGRGKSRPYPQRTLEEALAVPEGNQGQE